MTFGIIKSLIENNLLESYKNEQEFKKSLREFKHNVLSNKSMSRAYAIYDQLSSPQGLNEQDSKIFIEEGVSLLNKILPAIKLPTSLSKVENKYADIDTLVYNKNVDLLERVQAKKNVIKVATKQHKDKQLYKRENIKTTDVIEGGRSARAGRGVNTYNKHLD
jgi:hypothetical protein